ncbi:MAG TPA: chemotaxis protein CheW [Geobacteraceae bacterium]|nr:chemotaxis protein CheW [Geobacteraceae bacterium]
MPRKMKETEREKRPAIDWQMVRKRLDAVNDTLNRGLTPAEEKDILKARARALAREPLPEVTASEHLELLEFSLAYETYGVETVYVRETRPLRDITPVPCTPPFVLGLINVRGRIISVIDIKRFFDLPEKGLTDLNKVIIMHDGEMEFGILADSVLGVRTIPLAELQPSLPTLSGVREEYLKGVTNDRTAVLDGKKLLGDQKIVVHEEIEE